MATRPGRRQSVLVGGATLVLLSVVLLAPPLPAPEMPQATVIYDRNGQVLDRLYVECRVTVPLEDIPLHVQQAILAAEDARFYWHPGIDPLAIARAALRNVAAGRIVEGGSTITQQLARGLYLTPQRTISRKIAEAVVALRLELRYSKRQILELYLNHIYFGHGSYGVEMAAQTYFGKSIRDISLAEAALLAALPRRPEYYSPFRNREAARARQHWVLDRMCDRGYITPAEALKAKRQPLRLAPSPRPPKIADYFIQAVCDQVRELSQEVANALYVGGYRIWTTADRRMQQAAWKALREGLPAGAPDQDGVDQPQCALVALDPGTGHVLALVGGRDFGQTQFNRALNALRQPGSAFKPFIYAAALERGYPLTTALLCAPVSYPGNHRPYQPRDYGDEPYHYRPVDMREALMISDNVVAVKWTHRLGPEVVSEMARRLGITRPLDENLSLALGTSAVTPLELAAAYATFANGGYRVRPSFILRIEDAAGNVLYEFRPHRTKVLDERVAYLITDALRGTLSPRGTAAAAGSLLNRPAAGKTGTTEGLRDAWFVGYTPELVACVWVGHDSYRQGVGQTGGSLAAPIWARFVNYALQRTPAVEFTRPPGVVEVSLCRQSGALATDRCPQVRRELFIEGTQPTSWCPLLHVPDQPQDQPESVPVPQPGPSQPGQPEEEDEPEPEPNPLENEQLPAAP